MRITVRFEIGPRGRVASAEQIGESRATFGEVVGNFRDASLGTPPVTTTPTGTLYLFAQKLYTSPPP